MTWQLDLMKANIANMREVQKKMRGEPHKQLLTPTEVIKSVARSPVTPENARAVLERVRPIKTMTPIDKAPTTPSKTFIDYLGETMLFGMKSSLGMVFPPLNWLGLGAGGLNEAPLVAQTPGGDLLKVKDVMPLPIIIPPIPIPTPFPVIPPSPTTPGIFGNLEGTLDKILIVAVLLGGLSVAGKFLGRKT